MERIIGTNRRDGRSLKRAEPILPRTSEVDSNRLSDGGGFGRERGRAVTPQLIANYSMSGSLLAPRKNGGLITTRMIDGVIDRGERRGLNTD